VTHLRQMMLDELQRRNYAQNTVRAYIHAVKDFAKYFCRSPGRLGPEHIREFRSWSSYSLLLLLSVVSDPWGPISLVG